MKHKKRERKDIVHEKKKTHDLDLSGSPLSYIDKGQMTLDIPDNPVFTEGGMVVGFLKW